MTNKTKEQLAEELYSVNVGGTMWMPSRKDIENANKQIAFIAGWDARQSEIDELVAYIKNANIRFFTDESINEYNELIQKHTKK